MDQFIDKASFYEPLNVYIGNTVFMRCVRCERVDEKRFCLYHYTHRSLTLFWWSYGHCGSMSLTAMKEWRIGNTIVGSVSSSYPHIDKIDETMMPPDFQCTGKISDFSLFVHWLDSVRDRVGEFVVNNDREPEP